MKDKKKCPPGKILNPDTNRCIKIGGALYKKLINEGKISSGSSSIHQQPQRSPPPPYVPIIKIPQQKKIPVSIRDKQAPPGKIWNPLKGRYITLGGKMHQKLVEQGLIDKSTLPSDSERCPPNKIWNPKTHRCISRTGKKGRELEELQMLLNIKKTNVSSGNCMQRSRFPLTVWQKRVVDRMNKMKSVLTVHGTGCGKTLTAIVVSQCFLDTNPNGRVIFISPAALINNFKDELLANNIKNYDKYSFYSFNKVVRDGKTSNNKLYKKYKVDNNTLLIVDEAHNIKNIKSACKPAQSAKYVLSLAERTEHCLYLTATPYVNKFSDLNAYISAFNKNSSTLIKNTDEIHDVKMKLKNAICGHIDYEDCIKDSTDFPKEITKIKKVYMPLNILRKYNENLETQFSKYFFYANRVLSNVSVEELDETVKTELTLKIKAMYDIIRKNPGKTVIYSNWITLGVDLIVKYLKDKGISRIEEFTGKTSKEEKSRIVKNFNKGDYDVLIISKAGGEGIDLKGVRNIIIGDPMWNYAGLKQVIGRAIRYKSHSHLPVNERVVNVHILLYQLPREVMKCIYNSSVDKEKFRKDHKYRKQVIEKCSKKLNLRDSTGEYITHIEPTGDVLLYNDYIKTKERQSNELAKIMSELSQLSYPCR